MKATTMVQYRRRYRQSLRALTIAATVVGAIAGVVGTIYAVKTYDGQQLAQAGSSNRETPPTDTKPTAPNSGAINIGAGARINQNSTKDNSPNIIGSGNTVNSGK
jgi:hypothetical protein